MAGNNPEYMLVDNQNYVDEDLQGGVNASQHLAQEKKAASLEMSDVNNS